jgi:hypothetical protein
MQPHKVAVAGPDRVHVRQDCPIGRVQTPSTLENRQVLSLSRVVFKSHNFSSFSARTARRMRKTAFRTHMPHNKQNLGVPLPQFLFGIRSRILRFSCRESVLFIRYRMRPAAPLAVAIESCASAGDKLKPSRPPKRATPLLSCPSHSHVLPLNSKFAIPFPRAVAGALTPNLGSRVGVFHEPSGTHVPRYIVIAT